MKKILNSSLRNLNYLVFLLQKKLAPYSSSLLYNPLFIQTDITTKCNLRCIDCPRNFIPKEHKDKEMDIMTYNKLCRFFRFAKTVSIFGVGEPLLHKHFFEMIKIAKEKGTRISFQTNGLLFNDDTIEKLVDLDVDEIFFSIDGANASTYEKIRRGGNYKKLLSSITKMVNKVKNNKPDLLFCYTIRKENIDEIPDIISLASRVGVKKVFFQNVIAYGEVSKEQTIYDQKKRLMEKYEEAFSISRKLSVKIVRAPEPKQKSKCNLPWVFVYIRWDGKISPCCYFQYPYPYQYIVDKCEVVNKKRLLPAFIVGDLKERTLFEIWNNENYKNLRRGLRKNTPPSFCQHCLIPYGFH